MEVSTPPAGAASPAETVFNVALGYLLSRSLHVVTEIGIADLLDSGPKPIAELAAATGTDSGFLRRLLRTLAAEGIFSERSDGRFELNPSAAMLRTGVLRDGVLLCGDVAGDGAWWDAMGWLRLGVAAGRPAFELRHGRPFFEYLSQSGKCSGHFNRGMANFSTAENPAIAAGINFSGCTHVIDIAGGQGGLLAEILRIDGRANATLFELPDVARSPAHLERPEFAGRWRSVGGNFFDRVPPGGDIYLLKRILHDWSDGDCRRILRNCRDVMAPTSRLLVIEAVVPPGNSPHPAKVMDILMMVFGEGRERTESEFWALFEATGFSLHAVGQTQSTLSIIEARPI